MPITNANQVERAIKLSGRNDAKCLLPNFSGAGAGMRTQKNSAVMGKPSAKQEKKKGGVKKGKVIEQKCSYIADFVYTENGEKVVEDTKGFRTKDYIIKRKLMLYIHGIRIQEV